MTDKNKIYCEYCDNDIKEDRNGLFHITKLVEIDNIVVPFIICHQCYTDTTSLKRLLSHEIGDQ